MIQEELDQLLKAHEVWFEHRDRGRRFDIHDVDLSGLTLASRCLNEARMRNVNLAHAVLNGASLLRVELQGVNLGCGWATSIKLSDSRLQQCQFQYAQLEGSQLDGVDVRESSFDGANLQGAFLVKGHMSGVSLRLANLTAANCRRI